MRKTEIQRSLDAIAQHVHNADLISLCIDIACNDPTPTDNRPCSGGEGSLIRKSYELDKGLVAKYETARNKPGWERVEVSSVGHPYPVFEAVAESGAPEKSLLVAITHERDKDWKIVRYIKGTWEEKLKELARDFLSSEEKADLRARYGLPLD